MLDVGFSSDLTKGQTTGGLLTFQGFKIYLSHHSEKERQHLSHCASKIDKNTIDSIDDVIETMREHMYSHSWNRSQISGITSLLTLPFPLIPSAKKTQNGLGCWARLWNGEWRSDAGSIARKLLIKCFGGCSHVIFLHQAIRDLKVFLSFQKLWPRLCLPLMDGPVS